MWQFIAVEHWTAAKSGWGICTLTKVPNPTAKATAFVSISCIVLMSIVGCATSSGQGSPALDTIFGVNRPAMDRYVQESQQENALRDAQMRELKAQREERESRQKLGAQTADLH